jgi:lipoyl synthase
MPTELDEDEPRRVAEAVAELELEHVVITSVNRDELDGRRRVHLRRDHPSLPRGPARLHHRGADARLQGRRGGHCRGVPAKPDIYAHNLEVVERLHPSARPGGRYWRSISFLGYAKKLDPAC